MSIQGFIRTWVDEGRLHCWEPSLEGSSSRRWLFLTDELQQRIDGPFEDISEERRFYQLRADLDRFVLGQPIGLAMDPYKKPKHTYMARLDPVTDRIWDIRSVDPKPGIRIFGAFAEQDVFVAISCAWRAPLGGPGAAAWKREIDDCRAEWHRLFHPFERMEGEDPGVYVSENFIPV